MQRYTSRQTYELLLHEFPLPSFSYLKNLAKGGIEPIKGLKLLLQEGTPSSTRSFSFVHYTWRNGKY